MSITDEIKRKSSIDLEYDSIKKQAKEIIDAEIPERVYRTNLFPTRTVIALSGVALALFLLLGIGLINKNRPAKDSEIALLNSKIDSLANTSTSEEKMLSLVALAKEVQALSQEQVLKVHAETLSAEIKQTSTDLKNSVEWSDCLDMETDYVLLDSFMSVDEILEIDFFRERSKQEMWLSTDPSFYNDLVKVLDLPYAVHSMDDKVPEDRQGSFTREFNFLMYMNNEDTIDITVLSNGYVNITLRGMTEYGHFGIKKVLYSLVRISDLESIKTFVSNKNLEKYDAQISPISLRVYYYGDALNAWYGVPMIFNLDGTVAECSVEYGSFSGNEEIRSANVASGEEIQWNLYYDLQDFYPSTTTDVHEDVFVDVVIKADGKTVGYAVVEMKYYSGFITVARVIGFEVFRNTNGNYTEMPVEYIQEKIEELKEN